MTRREYIETHRHEIGGIVLDAAMSARHGAELSVWLRGIYARIDVILGKAYDTAERAPANGHPVVPPPVVAQLRKAT